MAVNLVISSRRTSFVFFKAFISFLPLLDCKSAQTCNLSVCSALFYNLSLEAPTSAPYVRLSTVNFAEDPLFCREAISSFNSLPSLSTASFSTLKASDLAVRAEDKIKCSEVASKHMLSASELPVQWLKHLSPPSHRAILFAEEQTDRPKTYH